MTLRRYLPFKPLAASERITTRLRFGLGLIGVVVLGAAILAALQARTILNAHAQLREGALPILALAQRTETDLAEIHALLGTIEAGGGADSEAALERELFTSNQRVFGQLAALHQLGVPADVITALTSRLNSAQAASRRLITRHATLTALEAEIAADQARISELKELSRRILADFAFQTTSEADTRIRVAESLGIPPTETLTEVFNTLLLSSLNISTIEFTMDKIANAVAGMDKATLQSETARTRLLLKGDVQDIIARLTQLPDTTERRILAGYIAEMRDLLSDEDGLFHRLELRWQFQDDLAASRATHAAIFTRISQLSSQLVERSLLRVRESTETLDSAVQNLVWTLFGAMTLAAGTVALTNRIVIERQFSQRIRALTDAVSAIARGNLGHPITVTGQDELAEMARALNVFRDNAEELARSNEELERFAYVAAHDLRAPLRAIQELSAWVLEDTQNELSQDSRDYLHMLQNRAARLNRLLSDLLNYARVGQTEPEAGWLDLAQLVRELANEADPEGRYNIRYLGPEHPICAQSTPVEQIIGNLLRNSVKHHDHPTGRIVVNADLSADSLHLLVVDDGPGIEPRYQRQVFELFKTLRPQDEIDGNGLGLAIVSKLVARGKGKVTVQSDPSKRRGAIFEVLLPLPPQNAAPMINETRPEAA